MLDSQLRVFATHPSVGAGIVMSGEGKMRLLMAYTTIRVLREHLHSTLPIELFYADSNNVPKEMIEYMQALPNVRLLDLYQHVKHLEPVSTNINMMGYQIKAIAILMSSFEEVVWMDVDNYALHDPALLFDTAAYAKHGVILWPDHCNFLTASSEVYNVFDLPVPRGHPHVWGPHSDWLPRCTSDEQQVETGQVVWDKSRAWEALNILAFMSVNHNVFLEAFFNGDKTMFFIALQYTSTTWYAVPTPLTIIGFLAPNKKVYENTMGQAHPDTGELFFLHRTLGKFGKPFLAENPYPFMWKYMARANALKSPAFGAFNDGRIPRFTNYFKELIPQDNPSLPVPQQVSVYGASRSLFVQFSIDWKRLLGVEFIIESISRLVWLLILFLGSGGRSRDCIVEVFDDYHAASSWQNPQPDA
jgi:hypothetical protein